jgi:endonuclease/exonuclease/phosphatase family metal-dependent hydrolase
MGDFNEWWFQSRGLATLRDHAELPPSPPTFPSWLPVLRLDRIAFSGCRLQGAVRRHFTPLSRRASDHLPILADLVVEGAPPAAGRRETDADAVPIGASR